MNMNQLLIFLAAAVAIAWFFPGRPTDDSTPSELALFDEAKLNLVRTMSGSLGVVAGLSWNESFKSLFLPGGPLSKAAASGTWMIAFIMTIAAMFASKYFTKLQTEAAAKEAAKRKVSP